MATLDIAKVFRDEANKLKTARERCHDVHNSGDIRAAGNEVEIAVRGFFRQMLPKRFCVTHGHLIDCNTTVSPQLDIIISDNTSVPSLLTTSDDTHYIPVDAAFAVGEIRSTFSKGAIGEFAAKLHFIQNNMVRPLVTNTIYGGITKNTSMRDIYLGRPHKYLNPLFSFMVFVSGGNADDHVLKESIATSSREDLPSITALLDKAVVLYGKINGQGMSIEKYPNLNANIEDHWLILPLNGTSQTGSIEGNHLGMVYYTLLEHLNQTFLEPPDLLPYLQPMLAGRRSACKKIDEIY